MFASELKEFFENLNDDEVVTFSVIHPSDKKYLTRSVDNQVTVVLNKPTIDLVAICAGRMAKTNKPNTRVATIFLAEK